MSGLLSRWFGGSAPPRIDVSSHTPGTKKGEEWVIFNGREPGRDAEEAHRVARDSTGINPQQHGPIDPRMPHLPPA